MADTPDLCISVLGELRLSTPDGDIALPASKKARALLAFLAVTGRPHRRERLCELLWDLPDDPKAALRWALSRLRKAVGPEIAAMITADRERAGFDTAGAAVDLMVIREKLRGDPARLTREELETAADALGHVVLDGLDGAGDEAFDLWLMAERQDAEADRIDVLSRLVRYPGLPKAAAEKWARLLKEADPDAAEKVPPQQSHAPTLPAADRRDHLRRQRIGFCTAYDGAKIAYATVGQGAPLVKAANWLTHIEHDWDTPIWGASFADLARDRMFVRYDERGCGLSDWSVGALNLDAFVSDLEAVVDKLQLKRFPLLGISQGAAVCIDYAVRHPDRVSGLVLIGGYASGWRHHASEDEIARRQAVRELTEVGWGTDNPAYRHIFSQTFMPDAAPEDLVWFDEFQRQTTSAANAARFQDAFGDIDVRDKLAEVQAPTLVLHAARDQRIPVEQGRLIASAIPDARFVPLDSKNHVLVDYEPAWTMCMAEIHSFLAEIG